VKKEILFGAALLVASFMPRTISADGAPLKSAPDGRPLVLTFADEFHDFRQLGDPQGVWRTTFGNGHSRSEDRTLPNNGELEFYVDRGFWASGEGPIPFRVHDGYLDIVAQPAPPSLLPQLRGHAYISGVISSQPSFSQLYGYFEMRAKIPGGKGIWPAFWLLPADETSPPEIDVLESVGDPTHIYMTTHSTAQPAVGVEAHVTPDAFHTYAVSWDKDQVIFYIDGKRIGAQKTPTDFHKPMYVLANVAVGGNWPGNPDDSTHFPAIMTVDFIRAYRFGP
jgi:beta-glucanase (GH16 family)